MYPVSEHGIKKCLPFKLSELNGLTCIVLLMICKHDIHSNIILMT